MDIQELISNPRESLAVELKGWINPDSNDGVAKIVKTSIAMRNNGGGFMLIGFQNDTGLPDIENIPENVETLFHIDKIQGMVTRYSSEAFEITVHFPTRDDNTFPVIEIGAGVRTPIATKRALIDGTHYYIKKNKVYIRSLESNNTPSTTEATWKDWERIVKVCFDNREADVGRFLRRHLGSLSPDLIREFASAISEGMQPSETLEDTLRGYLQESAERYQTIVTERNITLPEHGTWEVAAIIIGDVPAHSANRAFFNLMDSSNPNYTGWPVWLDSQGFSDSGSRPYVAEDGWEAFIVSINSSWSNHIDYWRIHPSGRFYHRRGLEDDISTSPNAPNPLTALDFGIAILRTAEVIAVALSFARAMGCNPDQTQVAFIFNWSRLRGRVLSSWANPDRYLSLDREAYQNDVAFNLTVPLDTPDSALAQYVHLATQPLFQIFDGFEVGISVVEDLTQRMLERRL